MSETKERVRRAPIAPRGELTIHQKRRKDYLFRAGKNQLDVAREIEAYDGKPCSRQAIEALIMDRMTRPSARLAEGFCRAVGYRNNVARLFPGYVKPKAESEQ
jgi:hypothetical protein